MQVQCLIQRMYRIKFNYSYNNNITIFTSIDKLLNWKCKTQILNDVLIVENQFNTFKLHYGSTVILDTIVYYWWKNSFYSQLSNLQHQILVLWENWIESTSIKFSLALIWKKSDQTQIEFKNSMKHLGKKNTVQYRF